ncbi:hypothetical protein [Pseudomonas viridiflava]|uniref:hypothetical protein n=1 Tax=Pseudomonas viridiflava TaxID=33069 RepID=UPI000F04BC84|nr:hypothetical protein [Pseudomonas viridiflava]
MNPVLQHISYVCLSVILLVPSALLGQHLSKPGHRRPAFKVGFVYNCGMALAQVNFFMKGEFLFLGTLDSSYIVFLGLVFSIFHLRSNAALSPGTYGKTDALSTTDLRSIYLFDLYMDRVLFWTKWGLIILITSAVYTVMIGYLLIQIPLETSLDMNTRRALGGILYLVLVVLVTYLTQRHYKVKSR